MKKQMHQSAKRCAVWLLAFGIMWTSGTANVLAEPDQETEITETLPEGEILQETETQELEEDSAAESVSKMIDAMPALEEMILADQELIALVREAYEQLPEEDKLLVANYEKLTAAEERLEDLVRDNVFNFSFAVEETGLPLRLEINYAADPSGQTPGISLVSPEGTIIQLVKNQGEIVGKKFRALCEWNQPGSLVIEIRECTPGNWTLASSDAISFFAGERETVDETSEAETEPESEEGETVTEPQKGPDIPVSGLIQLGSVILLLLAAVIFLLSRLGRKKKKPSAETDDPEEDEFDQEKELASWSAYKSTHMPDTEPSPQGRLPVPEYLNALDDIDDIYVTQEDIDGDVTIEEYHGGGEQKSSKQEETPGGSFFVDDRFEF